MMDLAITGLSAAVAPVYACPFRGACIERLLDAECDAIFGDRSPALRVHVL